MDCGRLIDTRAWSDDDEGERCPDCGGALEQLRVPIRRLTSREELTDRLLGIGA